MIISMEESNDNMDMMMMMGSPHGDGLALSPALATSPMFHGPMEHDSDPITGSLFFPPSPGTLRHYKSGLDTDDISALLPPVGDEGGLGVLDNELTQYSFRPAVEDTGGINAVALDSVDWLNDAVDLEHLWDMGNASGYHGDGPLAGTADDSSPFPDTPPQSVHCSNDSEFGVGDDLLECLGLSPGSFTGDDDDFSPGAFPVEVDLSPGAFPGEVDLSPGAFPVEVDIGEDKVSLNDIGSQVLGTLRACDLQMMGFGLEELKDLLPPVTNSGVVIVSGDVIGSADDITEVASLLRDEFSHQITTNFGDAILAERVSEYSGAAPPPKRRRTQAASEQVNVLKSESKKLRKMDQNRTAALRYRQKKRAEKERLDQECQVLSIRNQELHKEVDGLTDEISYLKCLMKELKTSRKRKHPVR